METAQDARNEWISRYVEAAKPFTYIDAEYSKIIGERLYAQLHLMRPEDAVAALNLWRATEEHAF